MVTLSLILMLFMGHVNPAIAENYHIEGVNTVEQALCNIQAAYPYWNQSYTVNEFDCSEMSAFVYDYLKACGLQPELKFGWNENLDGMGHAWVVCQGHVIECVGLNTVDPIRGWYDGFKCEPGDELGREDLDWWNSPQIGMPRLKGVRVND